MKTQSNKHWTSGFLLLTLCAAFAVSGAQAAPVFSDNFDSNALGLNAVPTGWAVADGTVDIIGDPSFFDFLPGNGRYIDLDGSTSDAGVLSTSFTLTGGQVYTASFDLAGNQRNGDTESVAVSFGTTVATFSLAQSVDFSTFSLVFTPSSTGLVTLSFANAGGDNIGMLLDNVNVSAVPVPAAVWLLGSALVGLGVISRRREEEAQA